MSNGPKKCIFCGSSTNKIGREHVFRSALRKHAPDEKAVFHDYLGNQPRATRDHV